MNIILETANVHRNLKKISEQRSASYTHKQSVSTIELSHGTDEGFIMAITFQELATLVIFKVKFSTPVHLVYDLDKPYQPLKIVYSFKNNLVQFVKYNDDKYTVKAKTASLSSGPGNGFYFEKDTDYRLAIIEIDRDNYLRRMQMEIDDLHDKLKFIFDTQEAKSFFFLFQNHHHLEERFDEIIETETADLTAKMYIEAKVLEVTSYILKLYEDQRFSREIPEYLTAYDLNQLNAAKAHLKENFRNPPTIKELAKEVALNEHKLKTGFKELFETTIYQFVINLKMEHAQDLLEENRDMPIAEVASEVGYINKSQFARRFQKFFGVLPKDYRKNSKEK